MGDPVLEILDLTVVRDGHVALERASITVDRGSIHLIVGPNGAGKSSLVAALLGEIDFTGTVRAFFRGNGRIGLVPQAFPIDPTMPLTVLDLLALSRQRLPICLGVRRTTRAVVASLLDRVGLAGFEDRRIGALSGGELRRVLLADAMDPDPEILILDEPAGGLDEASVARFESIVRALRDDRGTTVVMVSHDAAQVRRLADAVTWIDRSVRRAGTPTDVLGEGTSFPFSGPPSPAGVA